MTPDPDDIRDIDSPTPVPTPAAIRRAVSTLCDVLAACGMRLQTDPHYSPDFVSEMVPLYHLRSETLVIEMDYWIDILSAEGAR